MLFHATTLGSLTPMTKKVEKYPISDLVRQRRRDLGMTQDDFAKAVDRTRFWVINLEKGESRQTGKPFEVEPLMCVRIADVLALDPVQVLTAAKIPESEWPNFSNIVAKSDFVRHIDITRLTIKQQDLITALVDELKERNIDAGLDKKGGNA